MKKQHIILLDTWSHFLYCSPESTRWNPYLRDMEGLDSK